MEGRVEVLEDGSSQSDGQQEPIEVEDEENGNIEVEQPAQQNPTEAQKLDQQKQENKIFVSKMKKNMKECSSLDEQMEQLLKQAEYYANYLLSHHESARKSRKEDRTRKRGRYVEDEDEERQLIELEDNEEEYTHLSEQPSLLVGGQLKFYQMVGLNWMISLYEGKINGILADDMGLGKTIQTISLVAFLKQYKKVAGPHLIVAPKITLSNWVREFKKWMPSCKVVKLIATKQEREVILREQVSKGQFNVIVTSFQGVRICLKYLQKIKWKYLIIDEAHKIKNEQSMLSQVVRALDTNFKLLLTGTPLQNNLHELWSLLNFILPGIFDSSQLFDRWFSANNEKTNEVSKEELEKKNIQMIQQLHKILRPFMLRRTKKQVQKSLPQKREVHVFVGLTPLQVEMYKNLLQTRSLTEQDKKVYLNRLMQLRKVCNHPYLFPNVEDMTLPSMDEHLIKASGKMIVLDQLLGKLALEKHQVLIFSQMTMVLDILEDYCNFRKFSYCRIDGGTDMDSRDRQIGQFMAEGSDKFIFLLSTRAGGLGINLTSADTVIIYDSDYNPQMDLQAMDRAHRIGQKNRVNVYRLITENTVQEKIIERQTIKLKWDSLVIQQGRMGSQKNKTLSREEMKEMLRFGANAIFKADSIKGTMSEVDIEQLLARGEIKTNELNQAIQSKIKEKAAEFDLTMNSINIFDYITNNNKEDDEAMDEALARELQGDLRARRDRKDINGKIITTKDGKIRTVKKIQLPQYHFYMDKDILTELLQKEQEGMSLTEEEENKKRYLLSTGFVNWSRHDFQNFIQGSQKFGKNMHRQIAEHIGKDINEVQKYSEIFWSRLDQLNDKDRIRKHIEQGQERIANKKHYNELLDWKRTQGYEVDFNSTVYTKFRSKLFTMQADKYLVQHLFQVGISNMSFVRDRIRNEPMFRFDHFFRSRTESQLNKRMLSLYKLIEKERDISINGIDTTALKDRESKKERKLQKMKDKEAEIAEKLKNDESETKIRKNRKQEVIEIQDDQ